MELNDAKKLALTFINNDFNLDETNDTVQIIDEKTIPIGSGWLFFYNSQKFLTDGDFEKMLIGNLPVYVNSKNKTISYIAIKTTLQDAIATLKISSN